MIYAFKVLDKTFYRDVKHKDIDDLFKCTKLQVIGGFTGISDFSECGKDRHCFEWAVNVDADLIAYKDVNGWFAVFRNNIKSVLSKSKVKK